MKSRRWIAAAALAAAVVFLVMVTGEHGPAPDATPAPVSSSGAVLASDGGPPENNAGGRGANGGGNDNSNNGGGNNSGGNDGGKNGGGGNGGGGNGGGGNGGGGNGGGGNEADRDEVIGALQGLLDALGVSADELAEGGNDCGNGGQVKSGSAKDSRNGNNSSSSKDNGSCGQSSPTSAGRSGSAKITIADFAFGQPLTVAPGTTVEVVNTDSAPHNVTAADKSFSTPDLQKDDTATFTAPTTPGRYAFSCTIHPEMTGTLIVEGTGGEQGRTRSSEPSSGSQRGGSGGEHDSSRQHQTTAPGGRENTGGSSEGY